MSKIRVIQHPMGGSFGSKMGRGPITHVAGELARAARAPVKILYSREEEFSIARPRVPARFWLKMGLDAEGRITAKQMDVVMDCGAYCDEAPGVAMVTANRHDSVYKIANTKTRVRLVYTTKVPTGAYRGHGNPQIAFAVEAHLDKMARELNLDPVDVRLKNAPDPGHVSAHGWKLTSCALKDCIHTAAKEIGWGEPSSPSRPGRRRGKGLACMIHISGGRAREVASSVAFVQVHEDGRARVISGEGDIGQGTKTIFAQITAEVLGLQAHQVEVNAMDSVNPLIATGASGSQITTVGGNAVLLAAQDARAKLAEVAAKMLESHPNDIEMVEGMVRVKGAEARSLTLAQVAEKAILRRGGKVIIGEGTFDPDTEMPDPKTKHGNISAAYAFAAQAVDLEVDVETGEVDILNAVAAHDVGRAINPMTTEGQVEGGFAQGLGYALTENMDWQNGQVITRNFHDYLVLTSVDMPDMKSYLIEPKDAAGPFGAKGVGEPTLVPTAPAVHNALFAALGVSIPTIPFTPEKILRALNGGTMAFGNSGGVAAPDRGNSCGGQFAREREEESVTGPVPGTRGRDR